MISKYSKLTQKNYKSRYDCKILGTRLKFLWKMVYAQIRYAETRIYPRKSNAYDSLELWDTNVPLNPRQKSRPSIN